MQQKKKMNGRKSDYFVPNDYKKSTAIAPSNNRLVHVTPQFIPLHQRLRMRNKKPLPISALVPSRRGRGIVLLLAPGGFNLVRDDAAHEADEVGLHVLDLVIIEAVEGSLHGVLEVVLVLGRDDVHLGEHEGGVGGAQLEHGGGRVGGGDCGAEVVLFAEEVVAEPIVHCRHFDGFFCESWVVVCWMVVLVVL